MKTSNCIFADFRIKRTGNYTYPPAFINMIEIYAVRWTIEVFFKEAKQYLRLRKCQSRDFDIQIVHVTTTYILYTFLAYFRRINDYESLGGLFEEIRDDMLEKNLAERL